jgi:hypothetical protein
MTKYVIPELLKPELKSVPNGEIMLERNWITTNDLIYIYLTYISPTDSKIELSDLTSNLEFYQEPKKAKTYDQKFQRQLDHLRAKLEEEEYQSMIDKDHQFGESNADNVTPAEMAKEVKNQITAIANILLSVVSVAYAVWYWSNSSGYFSIGARVLMCLFFALLTLVADVAMMNAFNRRVEEAKEREKSKKEVKKVVERYVL